jgi:hypothetical protein
MKRWLIAFNLALLSLFGTHLAAQEPKIVLIVVDDTPKFDVLYHRARSNATGAVIGGLIGAGIQHGIESDKDGDKREELRPHVSADAWNEAYVKALNEALTAKGFEPRWTSSKDKPKDLKADVYVSLFPSDYGFRMVDTTTSLVSAYVEYQAIYSREPPKSKKKSDKETFYMTGQKQYSYEDLAKETSLLNTEVQDVLAASARRLANKIIYNLK